MAESTALATLAYEPNSITEALQLAKVLVESRLLPRSITTPQQAFAVMAAGKEMGLTAMQSLRSIHVIEGKPSCSADLILALCKRRQEVCRYFRLVTSDATVATYETLRDGDPAPTTLSFTLEQAKAASLTGKDNWKKYPEAMLRARCIAALARAVYPDLVLGVYETDEIVERPVNAAPVRGVVPDEPAADATILHDPLTGEVLDPPPAPAGDRLPEEAKATPPAEAATLASLLAEITAHAEFNAKAHGDNWWKGHWERISTLTPAEQRVVRRAIDSKIKAAPAARENAA